jgi:hypothetical protein
MGASYPDLNRCNFLFAPGDRRCRNPIECPGAAYCYFHGDRARREARARLQADATAQRRAATEAFFQWLCYHPLDTATSLHQAMNQLFLLLAAECISTREAAHFLSLARVMLKNVKAIHNEFSFSMLVNHKPAGEAFLSEMRETLVPAVLAERQAAAESQPMPPRHEAGNLVVPPPGPPLTEADYERAQAEFFSTVPQQSQKDLLPPVSTPAATRPPAPRPASSPPSGAPVSAAPLPAPSRVASRPAPAHGEPRSKSAPPTEQAMRASAGKALREAAAILAAAAPKIKAMSKTG